MLPFVRVCYFIQIDLFNYSIYIHNISEGVHWNRATLSDAMLKDLQDRCPNMIILELCQANLTNVSVDNLPKKLQQLIIKSSLVTPGWFNGLATSSTILQNLCLVDLSQSSKTSNADVKQICNRQSITVLKLTGCYRISEDGLKHIADNLVDLTVLHISETSCTDLALHHISRQQKKLQELDISKCGQITDGGLGSIITGLSGLTWLSIADCPKITLSAARQLTRLTKLKHLNIVRNEVDASLMEDLTSSLPKCTIIR